MTNANILTKNSTAIAHLQQGACTIAYISHISKFVQISAKKKLSTIYNPENEGE